MLIKKTQYNNGFTLVEIIVAIGLFVVIATMAAGALLTVIDSNRKAKTMRIAMDNLNVAIERMVREIRTGASYYCDYPGGVLDFVTSPQTRDCVNGDNSIVFLSQDGETIAYRKNSSRIQRSNDGGDDFDNILAPNIEITDLDFYVRGSTDYGSGDTTQAHVIISIDGNVTDSRVDSSFRIQTMATQRVPE